VEINFLYQIDKSKEAYLRRVLYHCDFYILILHRRRKCNSLYWTQPHFKYQTYPNARWL